MTLSLLLFYIGLSALTHVFGTWQQRGDDIIGESLYNTDWTGRFVSTNSDGTIVAIGVNTNDNYRGHVRVWAYDGGIWTQKGNDIDGEAAGDYSGSSVALSKDGNVVAIGADRNDPLTGENAGHTRIFEYNGQDWQQRGNDIDGAAAGDQSGSGVALNNNGDVVAIGAPRNDDNANNAGHVRVYEYVSNESEAWQQKGGDIDGEARIDWSGSCVSLSSDGSVIAIGARLNDDGGINAGHVRVYEFVSDEWSQRGEDMDGEAAGDWLGNSVSLSSDGKVVAIGALNNDDNGNNAGHVRVFEYFAGAWVKRGGDIDGKSENEEFGYSVSINSDGTSVAVGSGEGVRVYEYDGSEWLQKGSDLDVVDPTFVHSHISVSLSSDGNALAAGGYDPSVGITRVFEYRVTPNPSTPMDRQSSSDDSDSSASKSSSSSSSSDSESESNEAKKSQSNARGIDGKQYENETVQTATDSATIMRLTVVGITCLCIVVGLVIIGFCVYAKNAKSYAFGKLEHVELGIEEEEAEVCDKPERAVMMQNTKGNTAQ